MAIIQQIKLKETNWGDEANSLNTNFEQLNLNKAEVGQEITPELGEGETISTDLKTYKYTNPQGIEETYTFRVGQTVIFQDDRGRSLYAFKGLEGDNAIWERVNDNGDAETTKKLFTAINLTLAGEVTGTVKTDLSKNVSINTTVQPMDASKIISGVFDLDRIPKGAIERMVVVPNKAARFALTPEEVQNGDTVKEVDTKLMYYVVDNTKLSTEEGYEVYQAGRAAACPWTGVEGKPTTIAGYGITDAYTKSETEQKFLPIVFPGAQGKFIQVGETNRDILDTVNYSNNDIYPQGNTVYGGVSISNLRYIQNESGGHNSEEASRLLFMYTNMDDTTKQRVNITRLANYTSNKWAALDIYADWVNKEIELYFCRRTSVGTPLLKDKFKVWHEGNDGSGSGLDADTLDGKHSSNFINYIPTIKANGYPTNEAGYGYKSVGWKVDGGPAFSLGTGLSDGKSIWQIQADTQNNKLWARFIRAGVASDWGELAFLDSEGKILKAIDSDKLGGRLPSTFANFSGKIIAGDWSYQTMGYGQKVDGWKSNGPAISFGNGDTTGKYVLQMQMNNEDKSVWIRNIVGAEVSDWKCFAMLDSNGKVPKAIAADSATNADTLDNFHAMGPATNTLIRRGFVTSFSDLSSYWAKFASITFTSINSDRFIILQVNRANGSNDSNRQMGILKAQVSIGANTSNLNIKLDWLVNTGIDASDFKTYYNTSGNFELWCNCKEKFGSWMFSVLNEGTRDNDNGTYWTLYNTNFSTVQTPTLPSYITSTLLELKNPSAGGSGGGILNCTWLHILAGGNGTLTDSQLSEWKSAYTKGITTVKDADGLLASVTFMSQNIASVALNLQVGAGDIGVFGSYIIVDDSSKAFTVTSSQLTLTASGTGNKYLADDGQYKSISTNWVDIDSVEGGNEFNILKGTTPNESLFFNYQKKGGGAILTKYLYLSNGSVSSDTSNGLASVFTGILRVYPNTNQEGQSSHNEGIRVYNAPNGYSGIWLGCTDILGASENMWGISKINNGDLYVDRAGTETMDGFIVKKSGGGIYCPGGFFKESDKRVKSNIEELQFTLEDISKIPTVCFDMHGKRQIGTIAQDVESICPLIVNDVLVNTQSLPEREDWELEEVGEETYAKVKEVEYSMVGVISLHGVKLLVQENKELKQEVNSLKLEIKELQEKLNIILNRIGG